MIKPGALLMGVVMASVASAAYYGLDLLPPGLIPPPFGRAMAQESAESAQAPPPQIAAVAPAEPAPAAQPAEEAPTEQDLAEEPAPEPAPAAQEPEPAPAQAATPPPPPPVEKPAAKPAPKAEPKQAPQPAPAAPTETASAESAAPASAEADAIKPWWPDPSKMPANQLKLQYAGQVQGQSAIALLFTSPLKIDTLKQHASVRSAEGQVVAGEWSLGKNPKLAVFEGVEPGRYTVILQPQISDQQGYMLGATLKGPVYVKP